MVVVRVEFAPPIHAMEQHALLLDACVILIIIIITITREFSAAVIQPVLPVMSEIISYFTPQQSVSEFA